MPKVAAPIKTPLGHDEWRSRALGLGQRHRTMLFLVDGKRPLSEVLSLALQAGARTSHFEDLVRLGLVELDIDSEWPADATPSQAGGFDSSGLSTRAGVLSVEIASRLPSTTSAAALDSAAAPLGSRSGTTGREPSMSASTSTSARLPATAMAEAVDSGGTLTVSRTRSSEATDELVSQVRNLLLDTMRADAPLFAAITVVRVRRAQTRKDLIDIVWAIERNLGISRRKRRELPSLQEARELLGMGNTQITLDTQSFPDTD
jgi:hypothetical protein